MSKQYNVFLLETEKPEDVPVYLQMLKPLNWNFFTFTKSEDFINMVRKGTKPDIIISNYNINPLRLVTPKGQVDVTNSLTLIGILTQVNLINRIPTVLLLNKEHGVEEYNHCNKEGFPYLTKGNFEVHSLVDLLQTEIRVLYKDGTDYLHMAQYGNTPLQLDVPKVGTSLELVGMPQPQSQFDINNNLNQTEEYKQQNLVKKEAEVICFYNGGKGGVGKTTLATSISALLASNGSRTLLIDADFYAPNCYLLLKVKAQRTIIDLKHVLNNLTEESFNDCLLKHSTGLHFIAGPTNPKDVELLHPDDIYKIIHFAKKHYDYIIIDLPPKMPFESTSVDAITHVSDKIVQVTTQSYASIHGVTKAFEALANEGIDPNKFYLCVNKLNPQLTYDPESIATRVVAKQDYVNLLKTGRIPIVGKIGAERDLELYESMMELYILNSKTKFRKDMEYMVLKLIPDYKLNHSSHKGNVQKKNMKSNKSFLESLKSLFIKK